MEQDTDIWRDATVEQDTPALRSKGIGRSRARSRSKAERS
jgi:hypothetical protein